MAEPSLDIGNVETVLETLGTDCYYLSIEKNRYRFSLSANLNKILADRRANVHSPRINERVRAEIQKVFAASQGIQPYPFPEKSSAIPNRAVLTLAVLAPDHSMQESETLKLVESMTRESGTSDRTFKSALIWAIADTDAPLREEARKVLGREGSRVAIGQTQAGRYLRVIYVPDPEPNSVFVITAYELTGKPLTAYRRRQRRR